MNEAEQILREAVERGYPTAKQRRTWSRPMWDAFNELLEERRQAEREKARADGPLGVLKQLVDAIDAEVRYEHDGYAQTAAAMRAAEAVLKDASL